MSLTAAQQAELIAAASTGVKSTSTDGTRVETHSLKDIVEFLKFCNSQDTATAASATSSNPFGVRVAKRYGPGAV